MRLFPHRLVVLLATLLLTAQAVTASAQTYMLRPDGAVTRAADGAVIPPDAGNSDWQAYQAWLAAGNAPAPVPALPPPVRRASLSALFDPLSPAQRATITTDHKDRLEAEAAEQGGTLPLGNAKLARAAADLGMTPDAWFKLAGF